MAGPHWRFDPSEGQPRGKASSSPWEVQRQAFEVTTPVFGHFALSLTVIVLQQARVEPEEITAALDGRRIVVQGLYNGQVGTGIQRQLGMTNSNAKFLLGRRFDQRLTGVQNIEVIGTVRAQGQDVFVDVASVRVLPSDLEEYDLRAKEIRNGDFLAWYELAQWASQRDKRYPGHGLKEKVDETYRRGIQVERRAAAGNPTALRRLTQRTAKELKIKDFDFADIEHEILHAEAAAVDDQSTEKLEDFARRVRDRLPFGDREEMAPAAPELRRGYDADPIGTFLKASDDERKQLSRYWQVKLLVRAQERKRDLGRIDWLTLGEWADAEMPDYPGIAERWLEKAKEESLPKLPSLSRSEIQRLAVSASRSNEEEGKELRVRWLQAREQALRDSEQRSAATSKAKRRQPLPPNARERLELAKDYVQWFKDDPEMVHKAVELLSEALTIDPTFLAARAALEQLGYVLSPNGEWVTKENAPLAALQAKPNGTVGIGMTPDRVLEIKGAPDSRARFVTAHRVIHQWVYHAIDETTHVFFDQTKDGSLRVTSLRQGK